MDNIRRIPKAYHANEIKAVKSNSSGIEITVDSNRWTGGKQIIDYNNVLFIKKSLENKIILNSIHDNALTYIGKNSKIPRFKIKEYFHQHKLRKTKYPHLANAIILNKIETNNLINNKEIVKEYYYIPYAILNRPFNNEKVDGYVLDANNKNINFILNKFKITLDQIECKKYIIFGYRSQNEIDVFNNLFEIAYNQSAQLIYDEKILEQINENGIEVDDDILENLTLMLKDKKNVDNIKLGLELISNSNYKESCLKMSMIITDSWNSIIENKKYWTKNFISLLEYLKHHNITYQLGWKSYVKSVSECFKDDPSRIEDIKKYAIRHLQEDIKISGITITDIDINLL